MPALSFVAPANAVRYCGAWPTFVDVSPETWQWDLAKVREFLTEHCEPGPRPGDLRNRHTGRRVAALLPVHLLGGLADVAGLQELAIEFSLPLVEDAAEALGATCEGAGIGAPIVGEAEIRRIVCTSFNGNKIITTGGGGALLSNDADLARRARHLSTTAKTDAVEFDHDEVGYNYRMSNMAAALGVAQLAQLDGCVARKREIAAAYDSALLSSPRIAGSMPVIPGVRPNHWLYTILLEENSRPMIRHLASKGIQSRPLWKALPDLAFLAGCHVHSDRVARELVERAISLPSSVGLANEDQLSVISEIRSYLGA